MPENHPDRAALLNSLGRCLINRYERSRNPKDLEAAITVSLAAVETTPADHPDRAKWLNNLGILFCRRHEQTSGLQYLGAIIIQSAWDAMREDRPDGVLLLNIHGPHLTSRYQRSGNSVNLELSDIARAKTRVETTPQSHPAAGRVGHFGVHLQIRSNGLRDLESALAAYFESWNIITTPVLIRLRIACRIAQLLVFSPFVTDMSKACSLLHDAVHLLPLSTSRSLEREDQQYILGKLTGLVSLAASVALEAGQSPLEALRLLELGRSVTNGQLLDYRSDISDLMEYHPALAGEFDSLRQELDSPFPCLESSDMSTEQHLQAQKSTIGRSNKVAHDLDTILLKIRQNPGFENFLRADSEAYLLSAAEEGPIVVLNVTKLRSDAILVTKAKVRSIILPQLSHDSMVKYCSTTTDDTEVMRELLEWLWRAAVQPVLSELGLYPHKALPRIWWIGVGLMANAPIHAAAKFKKGRVQKTSLQYCLLSYTSTIRYIPLSLEQLCQVSRS